MKLLHPRIPIALIAICFLAAAVAADPTAADPTGTWQWTAKGHKGKGTPTTLQLQYQNGQLTGSISTRRGQSVISDASFANSIVAFSVELGEGVAKYSGTLNGNTITGSIVAPGRGGNTFTQTWTATRAPGPAPGPVPTPPPPS
jgi:hypothetical protein